MMSRKLKESTIVCPTDHCDLCGKTAKRIVCDHNWRTGFIRGWLCDTCNQGLGMLGDNPEGLRRALAYLEKPEGPERWETYRREQVRVHNRTHLQRRMTDPAYVQWRQRVKNLAQYHAKKAATLGK
jgi:hypothetical protein